MPNSCIRSIIQHQQHNINAKSFHVRKTSKKVNGRVVSRGNREKNTHVTHAARQSFKNQEFVRNGQRKSSAYVTSLRVAIPAMVLLSMCVPATAMSEVILPSQKSTSLASPYHYATRNFTAVQLSPTITVLKTTLISEKLVETTTPLNVVPIDIDVFAEIAGLQQNPSAPFTRLNVVRSIFEAIGASDTDLIKRISQSLGFCSLRIAKDYFPSQLTFFIDHFQNYKEECLRGIIMDEEKVTEKRWTDFWYYREGGHLHWLSGLTDFEGNTPIHVAAQKGNIPAAKALLFEGAQNPKHLINKNAAGVTPIETAIIAGQADWAVELVNDYSCLLWIDSGLMGMVARHGNSIVARALFRACNMYDYEYVDFSEALGESVANGDQEFIQLLCDAGALLPAALSAPTWTSFANGKMHADVRAAICKCWDQIHQPISYEEADRRLQNLGELGVRMYFHAKLYTMAYKNDEDGSTFMHHAVRQGNSELISIVRSILGFEGVHTHTLNDGVTTALKLAIDLKDEKLIRALI